MSRVSTAELSLKAVILTPRPGGKGLKRELVETEDPVAGPGELVVKMEACGLCGTDLEKMRGEYKASMPVVGHEAVGVIVGVGEGVDGLAKGDRVFPHHHVPCYECYACKSGSETTCDRYRSSNIIPGGFSQYFRVPSWNVLKGGVLQLPSRMSFEAASLIEPLACCVRAAKRSKVLRGESALVAGAGPAGMMNAILLKSMGVMVLVSDVSATRLDFAENSGVGRILDATKVDVPGQAKSETAGRGVDLAVVASGSHSAIIQGLRSIRKGGRVCLFGIPPQGTVLDFDISGLYNSEQTLVTSYGATDGDAREALQILSTKGARFGDLISHRFPLAKFDDAVDAASSGRAMKVIVSP